MMSLDFCYIKKRPRDGGDSGFNLHTLADILPLA